MQGKVSLSRSAMPRLLRQERLYPWPAAIADRFPNTREASQVRNLHHKRRAASTATADNPGHHAGHSKDLEDTGHCTQCSAV